MRDKTRFAGHLVTVSFFTAIAIVLSAQVFSASDTAPFGRGGYRLNAVVPSSSLLSDGARVRMSGAEVGTVVKVERSTDGRPGTRLELRITDERVTPVPVDSRVQVRTRSQVGENYVSIAVGRSSRTFSSGQFLPASTNDELVDVDQILSVLQGRTKERARQMLIGLGGALDGRGKELSETLQQTSGLVENGAGFVDAIERDRRIAAQLVDQLGRVASEVGSRGEAIDTIANRGVTALRALGDSDQALAETLQILPTALKRVRATSETVGRVTDRATPVVDDLRAAAHDLAPAVRALEPAARQGRAVVSSLGDASPRLRSTLAQLTALSKPLPDALPEIRKVMCQINPALRYIEPYKNDILGIAIGLSSASNSYDAVGHLIRLAPVINDTSASGLPPAVNRARSTLLNSGLFLKSKAVSYDPFMRPGTQGTTKAGSNKPNGPAELRQSGYRYPRIKGDC